MDSETVVRCSTESKSCLVIHLARHFRGSLSKIGCVPSIPESKYDEKNVEHLAVELHEKVQEADGEWSKIDRDLIKWFGSLGTVVTSLMASGRIEWLPAAVSAVIGGATAVAVSQHQRADFRKRYPAAMFLDLERKSKK